MNTWWLTLPIFAVILSVTSGNEQQNEENNKMKVLPKNILARRREEHFTLLKMIANNPKYEHRFQLISIGISKAFDLMNEHKNQLNDDNPEKVTKATIIFLENACLFMDFIVNFPDDIYIVLNKISKTDSNKNWKELIKSSLDVLETHKDLLDEVTSKEYNFVKDNIDTILKEQRIRDYPYENNIRNLLEATEKLNKSEAQSKVTKKKKKIKKGPALQGNVEL